MKAYLSSTFSDLVVHRERAYKALRSLNIDVIAMEDYVAADVRPVDRCLAHVASSELYIGIFAFRYGYVPERENPRGLSITEMEYRHAVANNIPRLIFLVPLGSDGSTKWRLQALDAVTGENEQGARISALRAELSKELMVGYFTSPDALHSAVSASVSRWLLDRRAAPSTAARIVTHHPREFQSDLLLLHAPADAEDAAALAAAISGLWRVQTSATGLVAVTPSELMRFDRQVTAARSVAVFLSPASMTMIAEDRVRSRRILGIARHRTGQLIGVATHTIAVADADRSEFSRLISVPEWPIGAGVSVLATPLHLAIAEQLGPRDSPEVGLPVVVVTMTATEAEELLANPSPPVAALLSAAGAGREWVASRYGQARSQWRPFSDSADTVQTVLTSAVNAVNQSGDLMRGRSIRLQAYPLDGLLHDSLAMWPMYAEIARTGCLIVVDELSLFHPTLRATFASSPLPTGEQVAFVTLSPLDPGAREPYVLMRSQLDLYLTHAARRFGEILDPLWELGVPERRRLERWLHESLPRAVDALREPKQDPEKLRGLAEELDLEPSPALKRLVAGERELA